MRAERISLSTAIERETLPQFYQRVRMVGRHDQGASMNKINDGGFAFPVWELNGSGQPEMTGFGMTLRDYFAAKALPAVYRVFCDDISVFETTMPEGWREGIALDAYALVDAMLKVRGVHND